MTDLEFSTNGERIMWRGKPKFNVFLLEAIFNPMLFVAIVWGGLDFFFIRTATTADGFSESMESGMGGFLAIFFLFHLMPVWLYLGGVITAALKHKHTEYIITERGIYISGGILTVNIQMKPFTDLSHVNIHKGIFDQMFGVGDVTMVCNHTDPYAYSRRSNHNHNHNSFNIVDIEDYQEVFQMIKNMQTDIYADTMYPNAMRPDENPGYNTRYNRY